MKQQRLTSEKPDVKYSYGPYNKIKGDKQRIRLTEGCVWDCPFCYEPKEIKVFEIPKIERNIVEISDMNLLCKKEALEIIKELGQIRVNGKTVQYEAICGFDFRFLTQELANEIKKARFHNIRFSWDWTIKDQFEIKDAVGMWEKAGYKAKDIMVMMIANWTIPYEECLRKLDLLKVWGCKVGDCCYDGGYEKAIPVHWTEQQMKAFRSICRKHNQLINFGIDPEVKHAHM